MAKRALLVATAGLATITVAACGNTGSSGFCNGMSSAADPCGVVDYDSGVNVDSGAETSTSDSGTKFDVGTDTSTSDASEGG